eukprot:CAMPEP_0171077144 /NCGR_PEP_ID=MMETSP0766_2-20121228/13848_1 /TAXON_ID=439317 /ORGANISM="Gambierdiscus australes, Strain CAWD 149" /LENGTH=258 /DNA_ID=CAMNT_0011534183 /DNA_START=468 /DNA_END=1242 /DNA_ORIENTATION=+
MPRTYGVVVASVPCSVAGVDSKHGSLQFCAAIVKAQFKLTQLIEQLTDALLQATKLPGKLTDSIWHDLIEACHNIGAHSLILCAAADLPTLHRSTDPPLPHQPVQCICLPTVDETVQHCPAALAQAQCQARCEECQAKLAHLLLIRTASWVSAVSQWPNQHLPKTSTVAGMLLKDGHNNALYAHICGQPELDKTGLCEAQVQYARLRTVHELGHGGTKVQWSIHLQAPHFQLSCRIQICADELLQLPWAWHDVTAING